MLAGEKGHGLAARMPIDRVLPKTDGPFTSDGATPLKPWDAWKVCDVLADIWSMSRSEVEDQLTANLDKLFVEHA